MKTVYIIVAALILCFTTYGTQAMTYEVDALYAEEAYQPYFVEVDAIPATIEDQSPEIYESSEETDALEAEAQDATAFPVESFVEAEVDAEADAEVEAEADADADADAEIEADVDAEEQAEMDAEAEEEAEMDAEMDAELDDAAFVEVTNATVFQNVSTANSTLVNAQNVTTNKGPNKLHVCGCWNGATCHMNVCICPSLWTGQYCENPSPLALARQQELERLGNLTASLAIVSKQVGEIESASGSQQAIQKLIADAAQKEIVAINSANAVREFHKALANNDMFVAREQMNLVKYMSPEKYPALEREFHVQEERIAQSLKQAAPGIRVMEVPAMQENKYKDIDVTNAPNTKQLVFDRANTLIADALAEARQFNLQYGDPV